MNNCDLLNFRFVDRIEAKKTLHDFINGTSAAPVLWISGEQGIGITRLIKEVISKNETETIDAICSFKDDKDPSQLNELITALKKNKSGLGISDFIRNNYSDVLDITKKISTQILKLAGLDIADFVASFYDSSKLFVDQKKQQHSSLNVLNSYISHIIKDNTLIVVLEHFTCCNKNYADAFIQLIINFMETQNIYFIITSTNEELESNCNFVTDFLSKIPIQKMKIEPLEDLYIYEILEDKFAISKEDRDIVCQLSKLCNGSPSRLRNTFSNMFMKGDISLSKDSDIAQTVFDKLKKDIASNDLSFKYDEFDLFSRTLLKLIIAFKEQASLSLLTKFSSKILEEEFGVKVIEEEILKSAFKLIENGIIGRDDKAYSGHKVKIENSLLRNTIEESIKAEPSYIMFSYWMQKHILENMEDVIASGLSKEMAEYLVAFHSVIGVVPDWVEIAVNYGILQFEKNNIAAAVEFFHHVREQVTSISSDKLKYSDVKKFYISLIHERGFKPNSMEIINTILHPVFTSAVRDGYIRSNPSDGLMADIKKSHTCEKPKRHALTEQQQAKFVEFTAQSYQYKHWLPLFTVLLGTGGRIGEILGLRWEDCDFPNSIININHTLIYRKYTDEASHFAITTPKTKSGVRIIPMLSDVKAALTEEYKEQLESGFNESVVDGYSGFIFKSRDNTVLSPHCVNRAIDRIIKACNAKEEEDAKEERREPELLPHFSCHHLRHTFCTRFCENETNLKIIQEIMGHADITTTMDIYNEATKDKKMESFAGLEGKIKIR